MAAETQLIPFSELSPGQVGVIRNAVIGRVIQLASTQLKLDQSKLVVRDIRAADDLVLYTAGADANVEDWSSVTGPTINIYETMAEGTVTDQAFIAIFGVMIAEDCPVSSIKFSVGGADKAIWQLQSLKLQDDFVGIAKGAVIIPQNTPYTISRLPRQASAEAFILLKGVIVEPRGQVITP